MNADEKTPEPSDHALVAWALAAGHARFEFFPSGRDGELCIEGLRHVTKLDEFGVPILTAEARRVLASAHRQIWRQLGR